MRRPHENVATVLVDPQLLADVELDRRLGGIPRLPPVLDEP